VGVDDDELLGVEEVRVYALPRAAALTESVD
jgi:hypothetical protein